MRFISSHFGFLLAAALPFGTATPAFSVDRPNILWLSAEDMSLNLGCYGDRHARTPNIDALAKGGLRFSNCFAQAPMCAPSRFTLITGMNTGPMGTSPMRSTFSIPDSIKGFPSYLRAAGYYCSNNVKTDYNTAAAQRLVQESWDESSARAHWRRRPPGRPFFAVFNYEDTHQSRDSQWPYDEFRQKVQSRLEPTRIHDPARAPLPPYYPDTPTARRTVARYYDCIATLDDFVRQRLDELKEDGVAEDTIVVFFADNGAGMPCAKATAFETGVREPLIVWLPEKHRHLAPVGPGSVVDHLVSFTDFAPTMLSLAGLDIPAHMQGRAFLGPRRAEPAQFVVGIRDRLDETIEITRWLNDGQFHYIRSYRPEVPFDQQTLTSFYNGGAKSRPAKAGGGWEATEGGGELCREIRALAAAGKLNGLQQQFWGDSRPAEALYDCRNDPWNLKNLAALPAYRDRLHQMRNQLRTWILEQRDLGFWPEPELADAGKHGPVVEEARRTGAYPLERILSTAELAGTGAGALPELRARLKDTNSAVRYWAAAGLHALKAQSRPALTDLKAAMADTAASVRIEAAWAVAEQDDSAAALALLVKELDSPNEWAACRAARALELLGEKARPHLDVLRQALTRAGSVHYGFGFSLQTAVQNLTRKP